MPPFPKRRRLEGSNNKTSSQANDVVDQFLGLSKTNHGRKGQHRPYEPPTPVSEESSSEEEEQHVVVPGQSYNALLKSLGRFSGGEATKRKLKSDRKPEVEDDELLDDVHSEDSNRGKETFEFEDEVDAPDDHPEDSDDEDVSDPFEAHFEAPDEEALSHMTKAVSGREWKTEKGINRTEGRMTVLKPHINDDQHSVQRKIRSVKDLKLKKRLVDPATRAIPKFDSLQTALMPAISNYQDLLYGGRTPTNADSLRNIACLHALNHVFKTRDRIIKNNTRLSRDEGKTDLEFRDQGFTRPKVLILLETRQSCVRYMDTITELCEPDQQENKKRFQDAFVQLEEKYSEERPLDFRELFEANDDNEFKLGVKFTRKTLKYYSQFYNSDIVLASPLGLRRAIKADDPKHSDYDFLSSIELFIVDQADAMLMQNWEHVEHIFEHLNLQPKETHGCDFSRVRKWYLDQNARYLRQTLVFSAYLTPELNGLFSTHMQNVAGKVKVSPTSAGALLDVGQQVQLRQTFVRYNSKSPASDPDDRFKYFTSAVVPQIVRSAEVGGGPAGLLVFIPSYLDFVRVRNYFTSSTATQNIDVGVVSEYTELPEVRRTRSHFLTGRHAVLLYTGRAHHFRRYLIKGVKKVIMYALPENPIFYTEVVGGFLGSCIAEGRVDAAEANVRTLFSKWDGLALERVVGTERVGRMMVEKGGDTFDFR